MQSADEVAPVLLVIMFNGHSVQ